MNNMPLLPDEAIKINISANLDENLNFLKGLLSRNMNLVACRLNALGGGAEVGVLYIDGISDKYITSGQVIKPLVEDAIENPNYAYDVLQVVKERLVINGNIREAYKMDEAIYELLQGNTIVFINRKDTALILETRKVEKRQIEKPENEIMVLGSKEAFTEDVETNCSMLIKRLPVPELRFKAFTIGKRSRSKVKLIWVEGIADPKIVEEARSRIEKIDIDFLTGMGALAQLIEENPISIFSKFRQTERPDMVSKYLVEGYIAVVCEGSPFAMIMPVLFWDNFKGIDDYGDRAISGSFIRILRYLAFLIAILICPLYLAFVTYNHAIVPASLAESISIAREGVPFPSLIELLLMNLATDILRESGMRMPGVVGYGIGTLGAVVIGQAAVAAGLVSSTVIIVVAISTIAVYSISMTMMVNTSRVLNYIFILASSFMGIVGLIDAVILVIWHAVSLKSLGIPYVYPVIPFDWEGFKDTLIRPGLGVSTKRMRLIAPFNRARMGNKKK